MQNRPNPLESWHNILTRSELVEHFNRHAMLSPQMAASSMRYWTTREKRELEVIKAGAWYANDRETYVLACSYLAHLSEPTK